MSQKNESPFANPRFLIALGVTFVFLYGWQYYLNTQYPPAKPGTIEQQVTEKNQVAGEDVKASNNADTKIPEIKAAPTAVDAKTFSYSDDKVEFKVSSLGFAFTDYKIKNYKDKTGQFLSFTSEDLHLFSIQYKGQPVAFNLSASADGLTYQGEAVIEGKTIHRTLTYDPIKQAFSSKIQFAEPIPGLDIVTQEKKLVSDKNKFFLPSFEYQDFVYITDGKTKSARISTHKDGEGFSDNFNNVTMASVGSQYFTAALINKSDVNPKILNKLESNVASVNIQYDLANSKLSELNQIIYVGAKKTEILNVIDPLLPEVLNYGIFGFISKILLTMLKAIQGVVGNWGVAIIILTLIVRALLLPLNVTSFKSAQAMQKIKPQMDAIRERYKNDPMRMNKETMALMKQHNANPITGCVPMLFQIPIFFAFFGMISTSVELYQQPFYGWITDLSAHDIYFVLPILMGLTMYYQQKLTPTTMDPTQAKVLAFMPILFTFFMLTLPSGLTLYNFVSALFGVVQQWYMLRHKTT